MFIMVYCPYRHGFLKAKENMMIKGIPAGFDLNKKEFKKTPPIQTIDGVFLFGEL